MAKRRDAVLGNKVVRQKKLLGFLWWVTDYSYMNTEEFHKWKMNECVDVFNKHLNEYKVSVEKHKRLIKDIGNTSGELVSHGPVYNIPGMLALPEERAKHTKPRVPKQNDDWKQFARQGTTAGNVVKHYTIPTEARPGDINIDGTEVFKNPSNNNKNSSQNNNNNQNKGGGNQNRH